MFFLAVLVNALHATLEDGEVAFNGVGVLLASDVLLAPVVDLPMAGELTSYMAIVHGFVGHEDAFAPDVGYENFAYLFGGNSIDLK